MVLPMVVPKVVPVVLPVVMLLVLPAGRRRGGPREPVTRIALPEHRVAVGEDLRACR